MDEFIEKALQKTLFVDYATLKSLLTQSGYKFINDKINYMKKKGLLTSLKKGFYIYNSPFIKTLISKEIIANNLLGPSYISYDYALYYHGLIPERVEEITSATTKRSKTFKTPIGMFSYRHIDKSLYSLGVEIISTKSGNFMIASPLKALCDKVYATKGLRIASKKEMKTFLQEDLRVDMDELLEFDMDLVKQYYQISKSRRILFLYKLLEEITK